ncbi:MAG: non-homologous end-joining DNA ligase [Candidatus Methylomirabilales bacterium]
MTPRIPFRVQPMLATLVEGPFHRDGWCYEEKYDGYRILAYKEGREVTLISRNARDRTADFPGVAAALAAAPAITCCLDGEVVAFDPRLVSRFQLLQQGGGPLVYAVFDCLYLAGRDLRRAPLHARREALEGLAAEVPGLLLSRRLGPDGLAAYRLAARKGFEGLVAKDSQSPYVEGRSRCWLKVKIQRQEEFVIGGYTAPAGARAHFGALLLGAYQDRSLRYVGKVGTGFTGRTLAALWRAFQPLIRPQPAFRNPPRERGVTWLAPRLVAQVAFHEWTADGRLRQPAFLGLREDKRPEECRLPADAA